MANSTKQKPTVIVSLLNPKGGVGKSTLAVNPARGLQVAECDPEGRALRHRFQHRIDGSK
jgi:cellulose biosynthesis protein BcsQ